jgi:hypothetical protein
MLVWLLQRLKAVMALLVPAITTAIIKAVETVFEIDIPDEWEVWIVAAAASLVGSFVVHQTPNLSAAKAKEITK